MPEEGEVMEHEYQDDILGSGGASARPRRMYRVEISRKR